MRNDLNFAVIGGDRRNLIAAEIFMKQGWKTEIYGVGTDSALQKHSLQDVIAQADVLLLPLPLSKDGEFLYAPQTEERISLSDIFSYAKKDALLLVGACAAFADSRLTDYATRPDFAVFNAIPTAEGALRLAFENQKRTVFGMGVGVVGFGKIGTRVAMLFHAVGASVSVFARKSEVRASALSLGYQAYPISSLKNEVPTLDLLINTVPVHLIDGDILNAMKKECLILDLASAPFGLDFEEAKRMGRHAICASALPGKYFPESAGKIIANTVMEILKEKSILF